ncbi:hypothetical protein EJB05_24325, partial [Eragrostis curvula]
PSPLCTLTLGQSSSSVSRVTSTPNLTEPTANERRRVAGDPRRKLEHRGGVGDRTRGTARSSTLNFAMAAEEDVKQRQIVETRARNISHNVRCTECGSQSIEDSQADVAILLRKLIRDEIKSGKSDKEIYEKLEDEFGETVLYAPKFDLQTAGIWLSPVIVGGIAAGIWAYQKHRQRTNVHIMALNLIRGVPLTPREKETMLDILTPPPAPPRKWWWPGK